MSEIYWITRLDALSGWLITFSIILGLVVFFSAIFYFNFRGDYEQYCHDSDKNWMMFYCKIFKISTPFLYFLLS